MQASFYYPIDDYLAQLPQQLIDQQRLQIVNKLLEMYRTQLVVQLTTPSNIAFNTVRPILKTIQTYHILQTRDTVLKQRYIAGNFKTAIFLQFESVTEEQQYIVFKVIEKFIASHPFHYVDLNRLKGSALNSFGRLAKKGKHPILESCFVYNRTYLIFYKKVNSAEFMKLLMLKRYVITQEILDLVQEEKSIELTHKYKQSYVEFITKKRLEIYNLVVSQSKILFTSSEATCRDMLIATRQFFINFNQVLIPVMGLFNNFEKQLFNIVTIQQLTRIHFSIDNNNNNIQYVRGILTTQQTTFKLKYAISDLKKSIVLIPTKICPLKLPPFVAVHQKPLQAELISFVQISYTINKQITCRTQTLSSMNKQMGTAIFLVDQIEQFPYLRKIFYQNNIDENSYKVMIKGKVGKRVLQHATEYSRFFKSILSWHISLSDKNANRVKNDFNQFVLKRFEEERRMKFVLSQNSQQLVEYALPIILDQLDTHAQIQAEIGQNVMLVDLFLTDSAYNTLQRTIFHYMEKLKTSVRLKPEMKNKKQKQINLIAADMNAPRHQVSHMSFVPASRFNIQRMLAFEFVNFTTFPNPYKEHSVIAFYLYYQIKKNTQVLNKILVPLNRLKMFSELHLVTNNSQHLLVIHLPDNTIYTKHQHELTYQAQKLITFKYQYYPNNSFFMFYTDSTGKPDLDCYYEASYNPQTLPDFNLRKINMIAKQKSYGNDLMGKIYLDNPKNRYMLQTHSSLKDHVLQLIQKENSKLLG